MRLINYLKQDKILLVTLGITLPLMLVGPPHLADVNWPVLLNLFSLLLLLKLFESGQFIHYLAQKLVMRSRTQRQLMRWLMTLSFFGAMILTNDVVILTCVPLILKINKKVTFNLLLAISLLCVAANLGSSVTPFGNPQNLYLFNHYQLSLQQLLLMAWPLALVSGGLLWLSCCCFSKAPLHYQPHQIQSPCWQWLWVLVPVAVIVLVVVNNFLAPIWGVIAVILAALILNRQQLYQVDYGLLATFFCFFIVTGILSRLPFLVEILTPLTQTKSGVFLSGILVSQVLSNVPAVMLLAQFTSQVMPLYLGVNIGGLGTLLASLANLLAFKQYLELAPHPQAGRFLKLFSVINVVLLAVLIIFSSLFLLK